MESVTHLLRNKKQEKNAKDVELRVVCHVPAPEHALWNKLANVMARN